MSRNASGDLESQVGSTRALTFERIDSGPLPEAVDQFGGARDNVDSRVGMTQNIRPRFSLRLAFVAVAALAIVFAAIGHQWRLHRQRMAYRRARAFVEAALHDRHLKEWHPATAGTKPHAAHGDHGSALPNSWEFDVIDVTAGTVSLELSKSAQSLDEFERDAVEQIRAGATEVSNISKAGDVRYVTAINSSKQCAACHAMRGAIAVVSVRGPRE